MENLSNKLIFTDMKDAFNHLQDALSEIESNDGWINYLNSKSKFYNINILKESPENTSKTHAV